MRALASADPDLAALVDEHGVPPRWARQPGFPSLVLLILEQQVSLASAAATYRKLLDELGVMSPDGLLDCPAGRLRELGVSRQKERYLLALAGAVQSRSLDLDALAGLADDEVRRCLTALPGIGAWTADAYLLACLDRPDVWPVGDRALQVAAAETLGLEQVPSQDELLSIGERWRPRRSTAARLLWHGYLRRRGRVETPPLDPPPSASSPRPAGNS